MARGLANRSPRTRRARPRVPSPTRLPISTWSTSYRVPDAVRRTPAILEAAQAPLDDAARPSRRSPKVASLRGLFVLRDHEDRDRARLQDVVADAAEQERAQLPAAARAHDDEIVA